VRDKNLPTTITLKNENQSPPLTVKKSKDTTNGETNLLHAQQKHKHEQTKFGVGSSRPLFIEPQNLASNCNLKYYQLEGVR